MHKFAYGCTQLIKSDASVTIGKGGDTVVNKHGAEPKVRTSVMLSADNREQVRRIAADTDRSVGYVVDLLVAEALAARAMREV